MVEYKCNNCNRIFKKKYNYECHLKRKYPCTKIKIKKKTF